MSLGRRLLRLLAIIIVTPVVFLLGCQSRLIYFPRPYDDSERDHLKKAGGRRMDFETPQGWQTAFYIPPRSGASGPPPRVWLCFAGNGSLALDWLFVSEGWDEACGYLLVDYPGYGDCKGSPSPASIRASANAATRKLADELGLSLDELRPRLAVIGHSIGCAAALMAAEDLGIQRAVLVSPFTTMTEMGRRVLGWPLCQLNLHRFDNRAPLAAIVGKGARVTIFHGLDDLNIPVAMSRELAAAHPRAVQLVEIPAAGHNDILDLASREISAAMNQ